MKPRAFIGSSVEGLNVAYAVQQNLLHDAEVTVWDQGVFKLSATTIESLTKALSDTDFGIFIFSPDDVTKMRGSESPSVRDNVLFELGLFIGKLGRERVFFLIPSESEIHIASDLIGITPGKYETNRTDGSLQSATAPACHQMRTQIKALGSCVNRIPMPTSPDDAVKQEAERKHWAIDFYTKEYSSAKSTLNDELANTIDGDELFLKAWILYCDYKMNEKIGIEPFFEFASAHSSDVLIQTMIASFLRSEGYIDKAISLLVERKLVFSKDPQINLALAACHFENGDIEQAISVLQASDPTNIPEIAIRLAEIFESSEQKQKALSVIQICHAKNPKNSALRFKYAMFAQELKLDNISLYLLDGLVKENANNVQFLGYLGNCCLTLDMYDKSLVYYRKALASVDSGGNAPWITSNIGNLFTNKGLPSEACIYLKDAVTMEPSSDYAHDRFSSALKKKEESEKEYQKKCNEGFRAQKAAIELSSVVVESIIEK